MHSSCPVAGWYRPGWQFRHPPLVRDVSYFPLPQNNHTKVQGIRSDTQWGRERPPMQRERTQGNRCNRSQNRTRSESYSVLVHNWRRTEFPRSMRTALWGSPYTRLHRLVAHPRCAVRPSTCHKTTLHCLLGTAPRDTPYTWTSCDHHRSGTLPQSTPRNECRGQTQSGPHSTSQKGTFCKFQSMGQQ